MVLQLSSRLKGLAIIGDYSRVLTCWLKKDRKISPSDAIRLPTLLKAVQIVDVAAGKLNTESAIPLTTKTSCNSVHAGLCTGLGSASVLHQLAYTVHSYFAVLCRSLLAHGLRGCYKVMDLGGGGGGDGVREDRCGGGGAGGGGMMLARSGLGRWTPKAAEIWQK